MLSWTQQPSGSAARMQQQRMAAAQGKNLSKKVMNMNSYMFGREQIQRHACWPGWDLPACNDAGGEVLVITVQRTGRSRASALQGLRQYEYTSKRDVWPHGFFRVNIFVAARRGNLFTVSGLRLLQQLHVSPDGRRGDRRIRDSNEHMCKSLLNLCLVMMTSGPCCWASLQRRQCIVTWSSSCVIAHHDDARLQ